MPNNNQTLSHCPACGEKLEALPVYGDLRYFICPTHRQFGMTGTAVAMLNGNPIYAETIGRRIQNARDAEQDAVITSDDLS